MTPAEKRVKELIDRWLTSLDLHLQYAELNDSAYNNVQPWPVHDRPTRWVLELAKQKTLELQAAFDSRLSMGDAKFADSVELVVFLANMVGMQHVQRFIPLADPEKHGVGTLTELDGLKAVVKPVKSSGITAATPRASMTSVATPVAPAKVAPAPVAANPNAARGIPQPAHAPTAPPVQKPTPETNESKLAGTMDLLVIEDAVRLINWGRSWHELTELIARIADRPKVAEVRRILRTHRADIERRVAAEKEASENDEKGAKPKKK